MDDAEASLEVQAGQIALKASQASLDALGNRVSSAETSITANANAIKLKASQSSVNSLEGRMDDAESEISQNASDISAKVSQTYGSSSSSFGWSLKSTGFYVYSNASTVMKITSSGLEVNGKITASSGSFTGRLYFGGNTSYYIDANYNDGSYYINLPNFKVDDASGAVFSGKLNAASGTFQGELSAGTVIGGSLKMKGDKIWLETMDNDTSLRICDSERHNYFYVGQRFIYMGSSVETSNGSYEGESISSGSFIRVNNGYNTYLSSFRGCLGGTWYSISAISVVSDQNKKNTIEHIADAYEAFYDELRPVTYKYNDGTSGRLHTGFIAQETEQALASAGLTTKDFAGVVIMNNDDGTQNWYLRYQEFISLNTWQIQKLKARVAELEAIVARLQEG